MNVKREPLVKRKVLVTMFLKKLYEEGLLDTDTYVSALKLAKEVKEDKNECL